MTVEDLGRLTRKSSSFRTRYAPLLSASVQFAAVYEVPTPSFVGKVALLTTTTSSGEEGET